MNIKGTIPLTAVNMNEEQRRVLASLWITNVEEFVAIVSVVQQGPALLKRLGYTEEFSSVIITAKAVLPQDRLATISQPRAGGGLGCLVEPMIMENFRRQGRVRPVSAKSLRAFEAKLPSSVRLMGKMRLVNDQGERAICVAFATVALREFLIAGQQELSDQFVYWACKELNGYPGPGTYLHTGMTVLAEYGVCVSSMWPYNPRQIDDNESQGSPPDGACENAEKYVLPSVRTVEPNLVVHYKHVLSGDSDVGGIAITFATLVFNSWYLSAETHRTGKITLPLPGEEPVGGHAWCVVGYVDDKEVPGGGYFILRNSWGTQWAPDSPEAAGHAMMPYEYVERYAIEAFTGPVALHKTREASIKDSLSGYLRELSLPTRDIEGKLLRAGTIVLFNPSEPDAVMEDTPTNRKTFIQQDCAWPVEAGVKAWLPEKGKVPSELTDRLKNAQSTKQQFCAAIEENLMTSVRKPFPEVHQPILHKLLPWEPRIHHVEKIADLSENLAVKMQQFSGVPPELLPLFPQYWLEILRHINEIAVYDIIAIASHVHVVVAFINPLLFVKREHPILKPADASIVELARSVYHQWLDIKHAKKPVFTFFTLGSSQKWMAEAQGLASGDYWIICSSPALEGRWESRQPPRFVDRFSLAEFKDRLLPETRQQRISRIKGFIDNKLDSGYEGHLHLEKIKQELREAGFDYRRSAIRDAMASIQERAGYRIYRTPDSRILAIDRNTSSPGVKIHSLRDTSKKVKRVTIVGLSGIGGGLITQIVHRLFYGTHFNLSSLGASIIIVYLTTLFTKGMGHFVEDKE